MAITEAPPVDPDVAPDVRGPTAPLPATILALGIAALVVVVAGIVFSQVNYALSDRVLTQNCIDLSRSRPRTTARSASATSSRRSRTRSPRARSTSGSAWGRSRSCWGPATYRRMDSKRRRDHAITGAVLGVAGDPARAR